MKYLGPISDDKDVVTKEYVDGGDSTKLPLAGGTLTGRLTATKPINQVVSGTGTTAQDKGADVSPRYFPARWTYNVGLSPTDGDVIVIKTPVAGHSYGVYISINNGTSYHPAVVGNSTERVKTQYGIGSALQLVFDASGSAASIYPLDGGDNTTTVEGGVWRITNYYVDGNSNTVPQAYCSTKATTAAKTATMTGYIATENQYIMMVLTAANTKATALTMNINSQGSKPIYINGVASSSSNYTLPAGSYLIFYDGTNYHFRTDGKIPGSITGDAGTVNGHSVNKDVPSNAVFTDTTYSDVTAGGSSGLMTGSDKTKLNGIATGAEVNQNAFSNVKVGSTTIAADGKTDTLELVAGSNVTLTPDATNDRVTINASSGGDHEELTQAEYDALSQAEKENGTVYFITDGTPDYTIINDSVPIGAIQAYAGAVLPYGWLFCDGSAVSRETYSELFGAIGTAYGPGDGSTTFNLPDLRGKVLIGESSSYAIGSNGGEATHTFDSGNNAAHNNMQPYLVGNYIIKALNTVSSSALEELDPQHILFDMFYPIGSYYETSDATFNPNVQWRGTWVLETAGQVHVSAGTGYNIGDTGGEAAHTLTVDEMPSHDGHMYGNEAVTIPDQHENTYYVSSSSIPQHGTWKPWVLRNDNELVMKGFDKGSSQSHNNMQPYIVVNRWHRTA